MNDTEKLRQARADLKEVRRKLRDMMALNRELSHGIALANTRLQNCRLPAITAIVREMIDETDTFGAINGNSLIKRLNKL